MAVHCTYLLVFNLFQWPIQRNNTQVMFFPPVSPAVPRQPPAAKLPFMLFPAISVLANTEPQRFECLSGSYTEGAAEPLF